MNARNLTTFMMALSLPQFLNLTPLQCVAAVPNELPQAMAALDAELQSDPSRRDRWHNVLELDRLAELVAQDDAADIQKLESIQRQFIVTEMPVDSSL